MFEIFLSRQTKKFLEKLDEASRNRIEERLRLLADNPFALPYKKIRGRGNTYRIRTGDYRVIYAVRGHEVRILKIDRRGRVYKR